MQLTFLNLCENLLVQIFQIHAGIQFLPCGNWSRYYMTSESSRIWIPCTRIPCGCLKCWVRALAASKILVNICMQTITELIQLVSSHEISLLYKTMMITVLPDILKSWDVCQGNTHKKLKVTFFLSQRSEADAYLMCLTHYLLMRVWPTIQLHKWLRNSYLVLFHHQ